VPSEVSAIAERVRRDKSHEVLAQLPSTGGVPVAHAAHQQPAHHPPAMEITLTQEFPAGLDALWATFGSPDYPICKYRALGATAVRMRRFRAGAQTIEVELERDTPVQRARLPVWARALVGRRQTLVHRSVWRRVGATRVDAELDIEPVGLPVHAHGIGSLRDAGDGVTRMVLTWQVESLLGDRIARLFADQLRTALDDDHAFTLGYLAQAGRHPVAAGRAAKRRP
jgi:hypothetical protein